MAEALAACPDRAGQVGSISCGSLARDVVPGPISVVHRGYACGAGSRVVLRRVGGGQDGDTVTAILAGVTRIPVAK